MIKFFFYVFLTMALIVVQTSLVPSISFQYSCFDLLLIEVLFFSLMFSHLLFIAVVVIAGFCMDCLSGGPPGLYAVSYVWIFILIQFLKRFVHRGNIIFLPCISAFSVLLENFFLFFSFFVRYGKSALSIQDLVVTGEQTLLAFFIIPIFVVILHGIHGACDKLDARGVI